MHIMEDKVLIDKFESVQLQGRVQKWGILI